MQTFQHEGHYKCKCGREFTKTQSYNAHLSHCKIHLGDERANKRLENSLKNLVLATEKQKQLCKERKQLQEELWLSEKHYCRNCGKQFFKKIGNGLFCSRACANVRELSIETKEKIAKSCEITPWHCKRSFNGYYKGIYCASSYELIYLVYMLDHGEQIRRCDQTYVYSYKGKEHVYIPDFYLEDTNTIIEIKGQYSDIVDIKAQAVDNANYKILYEKDLKDYWLYCKEKYNVKTYRELCELLYEKENS